MWSKFLHNDVRKVGSLESPFNLLFALCGPKFVKLTAHAENRFQLTMPFSNPFDDIIWFHSTRLKVAKLGNGVSSGIVAVVGLIHIFSYVPTQTNSRDH